MRRKKRVYFQQLFQTLLSRPFIPSLILISSLLATVIVSSIIAEEIHQRDESRFDTYTRTTQSEIQNTLEKHIALLRGTRGYVATDNTLTREEFHSYIQQLKLQEYYPGVQGIGYSVKIPEDVASFIESVRVNDLADFTLKPDIQRDEYHTILYLEPLDRRNREALGFDMFSEPVRRKAMSAARDSGKVAMTGKVTLVQEIDQNKQAGFLIYAPVYQDDTVPTSLQDKRKDLVGFVYAPFRINDLLESIHNVNTNPKTVFKMYDGTNISSESLLFTSPDTNTRISSGYKPMYSKQTHLNIAQQKWTITHTSTPEFDKESNRYLVPLIVLAGVILSLFLFTISYIQLLTQRQKTEILEGITDGFVSFNRNWDISYVNQEGARLVGRKHKELLGKNLWKEFPGLDKTKFGGLYKQSMEDGKTRQYEDFYDPLSKWIEVKIYPSKSGLSLAFNDISERVRLEKQKDEFLAVASHELKTPITSIKAFGQVLQRVFRKKGEKEALLHLNRMDTQIDRLTHLVNDLLDVSKIQAGKIEFHEDEFSFNELVHDTIEGLQHTTLTHKFNARLGKDVKIHGDKDRITQVITNFITNAVKYSPQANKLNISTKVDKTDVTFCVKDYGKGIPKNEHRRIFERFYRVQDNTTITSQGLGLGLFISSEIIKRQRGKIWVESTEGKGSIFCFSLPYKKK